MSSRKLDYLVVGQGIAGTLFSYNLWKNGHDFLIVDSSKMPSATAAAAGIMNPITGKFLALSWNYENLFPIAKEVYQDLLSTLGLPKELEKSIVRALRDEKMLNEWRYREGQERYEGFMESCELSEEERKLTGAFPGFGGTRKSFQVPISKIRSEWNRKMVLEGRVSDETFHFADLDTSGVNPHYKGIAYKNVVFCEGSHVVNNPFFQYLPFDPAKGDVLLVKLPDWKFDYIYKNQLFIAPWTQDGIYWVGSNYEWKSQDWNPTEEKKNWLLGQLKQMYHGPFEVVGQLAGIRPAIKDRKPVLGRHPEFKAISIFNGMGTKGTSLAPFYAKMLYHHLEKEDVIPPEVHISRFTPNL